MIRHSQIKHTFAFASSGLAHPTEVDADDAVAVATEPTTEPPADPDTEKNNTKKVKKDVDDANPEQSKKPKKNPDGADATASGAGDGSNPVLDLNKLLAEARKNVGSDA